MFKLSFFNLKPFIYSFELATLCHIVTYSSCVLIDVEAIDRAEDEAKEANWC